MFHMSSRRILGWPLYLFSLPIFGAAYLKNLRREPLVKNIDGLAADEWVTREWCFDCEDDTDHLYLEFRDEPIVEVECQRCRKITVHEDEA